MKRRGHPGKKYPKELLFRFFCDLNETLYSLCCVYLYTTEELLSIFDKLTDEFCSDYARKFYLKAVNDILFDSERNLFIFCDAFGKCDECVVSNKCIGVESNYSKITSCLGSYICLDYQVILVIIRFLAEYEQNEHPFERFVDNILKAEKHVYNKSIFLNRR